jgi:digeranylgeranylglycerophospholipid reductase
MDAYDVVVVGAGPAGSLAARSAAEAGATVLLVDHRPELGQPVQCGEFLPSAAELRDVFGCDELIGRAYTIPEPTVLRTTREMVCIAPTGRQYRFPLGGVTVSRRAFDKALALSAEGAGAELRFPCGVSGVRDDAVRFSRGGEVRAKAVVAADGPTSTVGASLGFHPRRVMYRMVTATADGPLDDTIALYFGRDAPRGYAWSFPRAHDLNVGLGVTDLAPGTSLKGLLARFLEHAELGPAREPTMWWVPIGPPPPSLVRGRALFAGDAANLVMATNGGGIPTAMLSGWLAGAAAADHALRGAPLGAYDAAVDRTIRPALARGAAVQRFGDRFAPSDLLLAGAMRFIGTHGLDRMMRLRWPWPWRAS